MYAQRHPMVVGTSTRRPTTVGRRDVLAWRNITIPKKETAKSANMVVLRSPEVEKAKADTLKQLVGAHRRRTSLGIVPPYEKSPTICNH